MKKRIIGLIGLMVLTANLFAGQIFYVTEGGAGNKDGTSWANAFADVQTAIDKASSVATTDSPSEVWIAKGTYKHGSAMTMKNNVAIFGGFAGTETSKEERTSGNFVYLDGEGKYRVFYNNYSSSNKLTNSAKLDNVTIQNGYTSGSGAGMYNYYASPEITNCTFSGNSAGMYGGGMYNDSSSSPVLTNCTFSGNSAKYGDGMYNSYSSPKIISCTFFCGIYNYYSSNPVILNSIICNGIGYDGYSFNTYPKPTIDTCIIIGRYSNGYGTYTNIITTDPLLQALADNGGRVQTIAVGAGSSAIGAGKVIEGVTTDARGVVRSTTAPTIGAYEYVKVQTAFESWAENTGLTGDNAKSTATPYNDGITNLEKFTFGLDASRATSYDANANFKHTSDATGASLQFPVSVDAEGVVQVKALKSADLINWMETTATATGETSSDGKFKIYKATAPVGEDGKVFLKLQVEEK